MLCFCFMYAHGKLDVNFILAMPKQGRKIIQSEGVEGTKLNELCTQIKGQKRREK